MTNSLCNVCKRARVYVRLKAYGKFKLCYFSLKLLTKLQSEQLLLDYRFISLMINIARTLAISYTLFRTFVINRAMTILYTCRKFEIDILETCFGYLLMKTIRAIHYANEEKRRLHIKLDTSFVSPSVTIPSKLDEFSRLLFDLNVHGD